ncbi:uncharacterized protein [Neodiprion pinetum]|uniref:uncharacterized protein n=1 Tax=Neodiprion pinetum TaxID=441929 RepID=UPI00371E94AD
MVQPHSKIKTSKQHISTSKAIQQRSSPTVISSPVNKAKSKEKDDGSEMDEQLRQVRLERDELIRIREELARKQDDNRSRKELEIQLEVLQNEKEAQNRASNELRQGVNNQQVETTNSIIGGLINHFQGMQLDIKVPKFCDEDGQNPLEFLSELENYFNVSSISDGQRLRIINSTSMVRAKIWFDMNKDVCDTYENFKRLFRQEFYSVQYQVEVKSRWSVRRYRSREGSLRNNFSQQNREAKYFEPRLSCCEINFAIVQQLPRRIRDILATIDFSDTKSILQALANLDSSHDEKENDRSSSYNLYHKSANNGNVAGMRLTERESNSENNRVIHSHHQQRSYRQSPYSKSYSTENHGRNNVSQPSFVLPNTKFPPPTYHDQYQHNYHVQNPLQMRYQNQHLN